jgi:hypothetical protein
MSNVIVQPERNTAVRKLLRENALSIVLLSIFFVLWVGQSVAGFLNYNNDETEHGRPSVSYIAYLKTPAFLEATMENWESEFLQMGAYIVLTAFLVQKGSAESKKLDEPEAVDRDPREAAGQPDAPWPVRRGGFVLKLYENSLSIAFMTLFLISFWFHAVGGSRTYSQEQIEHGQRAISVFEYFLTPRFWFESLQNWQSEFLAIAAMVILTIFLRQRGSPESKPVHSAHSATGHD